MHKITKLLLILLSSVGWICSGFSLSNRRQCSSLKYASRYKSERSLSSNNTQDRKPITFSTISSIHKVSMTPRGGVSTSFRDSLWSILIAVTNLTASLWGAIGVVAVLGKSIKRILPIALEPFGATFPPLSPFQLVCYIATSVWFAYVEGYKGFQLRFSPLVVARAQTLKPLQGTPIHHTILGPFYSMGLFHATKKRKIISWSVSLGVGLIVAAVKRLPYPWRNIIDAGVVVGLSWGSLSILTIWLKTAVFGRHLAFNPALPEGSGDRNN